MNQLTNQRKKSLIFFVWWRELWIDELFALPPPLKIKDFQITEWVIMVVGPKDKLIQFTTFPSFFLYWLFYSLFVEWPAAGITNCLQSHQSTKKCLIDGLLCLFPQRERRRRSKQLISSIGGACSASQREDKRTNHFISFHSGPNPKERDEWVEEKILK